jgi:hypothetical protein
VTDGQLVVDGIPVAFEPDDSVAIAIVRSGGWPSSGGTLCLAGDCGNCLVEVDGVAYVRSCQVGASAGLEVRRHPAEGKPVLPEAAGPETEISRPPRPRRRRGHRRRRDRAQVRGCGPIGRPERRAS